MAKSSRGRAPRDKKPSLKLPQWLGTPGAPKPPKTPRGDPARSRRGLEAASQRRRVVFVEAHGRPMTHGRPKLRSRRRLLKEYSNSLPESMM